ncbi:hypothetical protein [Lewinella sp. IMCC34183]|uniref:hypothetical protein n=1 Tax=Lewinella sp. IMCC34183 TaxID=2248762 RepID=UPI000E22BB7B|nr:hypothetical protein [Lewinella sp. IMCC34183]
MNDLSELVGLLGKDYTLCTCQDTHDTSLQTLFTYLQNAEEPTREGAAEALALRPGTPAFRKVKHRLKIKLVNALTAIHVSDRSADRRQRTLAYVWKLIAIGQQLRTSIRSRVLLPYLEEAHRIAVSHDMVEAAYRTAVMLRRQYANRRFDRSRYEYFAEQSSTYRRLTRDFEDAVADLNQVTFLRNTHADAETIVSAASAGYERSAPLIERHDRAIVSYIVFLLQLNKYLAVNDYERVIGVAERAIAYLDQKEGALPTMYQVFEANLTVAYTQLNDYQRGTEFARRLLAKTSPDDYNYLKVHELLLLLALRAGRFQEAYASYRSIDPDTLTSDLLSYYNETFRIMEAYLYLLIRLGQIVPDAEDSTVERFRISRFINSFDFAAGEKSHRNIHLLIIEIVDHVINRRHTKSTHSIESIGKYATRHLRGPEYRRVRIFLKALAQLSTQQFHRTAVERHTRRYVEQLQKYPLNESRLDYYMELVPYETLWNLIVEQLGYRRIRIRSGRE